MLKPYLDINQQIQNLTQNKGLTVSDTAFARQKLTNIGYFSLIGGYKTPFINPMTRMYNTGTDFADIYALYLFDKSLRRLTFAYLNDIEIKLGQVISDIFCSKYGEQQSAYLSAANYTPDRRNPNALPKLISILDHFANRDTEHTYIVHQRRRYNNVPLWVVKQALTFGQLSKMYARLKFQQQSAVFRQYENVTERDLGRYLNNLTFFRNVCAHNERLFSHRLIQRDFPDTPLHAKMGIPKRGNQYIQGKSDYFGLVIAFRYLLPREDFLAYKRELKKLINSYTSKNQRISHQKILDMMGMPANWETITRYKL